MFRVKRKPLLIAIGIALLSLLTVIAVAALVIARRAAPLLKARIIETLEASFHGRVELQDLDVAAMHGFEVTGGNLRIYLPQEDADAQPFIALRHFEFHAPWRGMFIQPMQVGAILINGLEINIPPPGAARRSIPTPEKTGHKDKAKILVEQLVCDNSRLVIGNSNPEKEPKTFLLQHIELRNVGGEQPWKYQATLVNAIPRGDIQASGAFGPWQIEQPGDTPVNGHYTFQHADLNTIRGLGGTLSSTGDFQGQLDRIFVEGTTETPDFSLDTANQPVPLHTHFRATVDGITGDTTLEPVEARLRNSVFTARGTVIDIKGKGHVIDLDVDVTAGQLQDFLALTVKTRPVVLTAAMRAKAKLHIRNGKQRVAQKLSIAGRFNLRNMHFTNSEVQDKVDMLSYRASGQPELAKPGAEDVRTNMSGQFSLQQSVIKFQKLAYSLPGAQVNLTGDYSLDGELFDFRGHVLTDVPLSKMVVTRWKSLALRAAAPFFRRKGGGANIPVKISGTRSAPRFGLDIMGH